MVKRLFDHLDILCGIFLGRVGLAEQYAHILAIIIMCIAIAFLAVVTNYSLKIVITTFIRRWVERSSNKYDDIFYEKGVFTKLSHLGSAAIVSLFAPVPFSEYSDLIVDVQKAVNIYVIVIAALVIIAVINALTEIFITMHNGKYRFLGGYLQMFKIFVILVGGMLVISILVKKDVGTILAGIAAFAAVLFFVFKDLILGIIAGIQISSNDIVRIGDHIDMPGRHAEGTVVDISLNMVKVLNSNHTISIIPSYAIVTETFQNWRGLEIVEGRRIKRTLNIDVRSIQFVSAEFSGRMKTHPLLGDFYARHEKPLNDPSVTNLSVFRFYAEEYLRRVPEINKDQKVLVRHLQPTEFGLPIELFAYTKLNDSAEHETVQNRLFEHFIAIIPAFGLRIYQRPAGGDIVT
jgi:miniconductance mechanosensitive channel